LTHTFPLDFADAISGLDAVPPAGDAEADFFGALAAGALAAGDAAELEAGVEVVAGAALGAAEDFWLLVFAAEAAGVLAAGALAAGEEVAGVVASAFADFLPLLLFFAVVVSEAGAVPVEAAGVVLESAPADFLLLFFVVVLSDEPAALAEVEPWSASLVEDFFLLDFDLLVVDELSALPVSELAALSDFVLFLDFVPEDVVLDDFVPLVAAV
jgi:hypothetical protein